MPKWLTDENVPRQIIRLLRDRGFDTADVRERGMDGADDAAVFALAQREERILVTPDRDFSNMILYPPATHHGIVVLRMNKPTGVGFVTLFESFLDTVELQTLSRTPSIVSEGKVRQRR